jgi:4-aminobutyrate aminotransferase and related aminotransferases
LIFIGDVRGYGPMIGVEIVIDKESKNPDKEKKLNKLSQTVKKMVYSLFHVVSLEMSLDLWVL